MTPVKDKAIEGLFPEADSDLEFEECSSAEVLLRPGLLQTMLYTLRLRHGM